jgi:hypothetical protein
MEGGGRLRPGFTWLKMAESCEYGYKTSGSVKSGEFLNYPKNY